MNFLWSVTLIIESTLSILIWSWVLVLFLPLHSSASGERREERQEREKRQGGTERRQRGTEKEREDVAEKKADVSVYPIGISYNRKSYNRKSVSIKIRERSGGFVYLVVVLVLLGAAALVFLMALVSFTV